MLGLSKSRIAFVVLLLAGAVTTKFLLGSSRSVAAAPTTTSADPGPAPLDEDGALVRGLWERIYLEQDKRPMTTAEIVVLRVIDTQADVSNGGWNGYFTNSAGDHAREAEAALREVGLPGRADILRRAMGVFPGGPDPDNEKRNAAIERLPDEAFDTWTTLSNEWFAASDYDFDAALVRYARGHGLGHLRP